MADKKELFGKYKAEVVDVNDPEKRGRIRCKCPKVMQSETPLEWAESCFPPGIFDVPKRGDVVWIEFEEGHIDAPIWSGMLCSKEYVKKFFENTGIAYNPKIKFWITENDESLILYVNEKSLIKMTPTYSTLRTPVLNIQPKTLGSTAKDYVDK